MPIAPLFRHVSKRFNHFRVLNVPEHANAAEIKAAFRKLAQQYHPDKYRRYDQQDIVKAHARFVSILASYEVLVDDGSRIAYLHSLRSAKTHAQTRTTQKSSANNQSPFHQDSYNNTKQTILEDRNALRSWSLFQKAWEKAINATVHGSEQFTQQNVYGIQSFPEHIESEELISMDCMGYDSIIMHLVSGSYPLATVAYRQHVTTLESQSTDIDTLQLFCGASLHSAATRHRNRSSNESTIRFHSTASSASCNNVISNKDKLHHIATVCLGKKSMFGTIEGTLSDVSEELTHHILIYKFPGVHNLHIVNLNDKFVEFKCTRAWMPDSRLWPVPPRLKEFDAGGWYIQRNEHGKYSRLRQRLNMYQKDNSQQHENGNSLKLMQSLDPSIPVLLCAFLSLDRMQS